MPSLAGELCLGSEWQLLPRKVIHSEPALPPLQEGGCPSAGRLHLGTVPAASEPLLPGLLGAGTACSALCSCCSVLAAGRLPSSTLQVQKKLKLAAVDSVFLASVGARRQAAGLTHIDNGKQCVLAPAESWSVCVAQPA